MRLRVLGFCVLLASLTTTFAQESSLPDKIPAFEFDHTWPKQLPNNWILGNIAGVHVDNKDQIWVLHRGNTVPLGMSQNYGVIKYGECCQPAPAFIAFDQAGNVVKAWGGQNLKRITVDGQTTSTTDTPFLQTQDGYDWPREHGLFVDHKGNVWTGCDQGVEDDRWAAPTNCGSVTKFTNDGKVIWQKGRWGQGKGNMDREAFNRPSGIFVDPTTNEAYISDGYGNKRVAVLDADTGEMKRIWGPYGMKEPPNIGRSKLAGSGGPAKVALYDPNGPPPKLWGDTLHCVEVSRDGLVYICDRSHDRIQVFKRDGTFVKEGFVRKETRALGSTFDVAFSADPQQKWMYVADGSNKVVHILVRDTLEVVGHFSHGGRRGGELLLAHVMATDSKGNVYVGETIGGDRIQRWKFVGLKTRTR
jgi:DNA-binding beta-propeller fold protein YncE